MKNLFLTILGVLLIFPAILFGQAKRNYVGEWYQRSAQGKSPQQANIFSKGTSDFVRTKRYNLNANSNQLNSILNTQPALLNLVVPYGDKTYTLNLSKVEVTAAGFGVRTNNGKSSRAESVQYRGIVDNNPQYIASLSISSSDIMGFFSTSEGNFTITKEGLQFIVYNQKDMPVPEGINCATPDVTYQVNAPTAPVSGIGCKTVNIYLECDYAFYLSKGSNISTLTSYVIAFFNQVATLYANENIAMQISEMFVWTSTDPYASMTNSGDVLSAFRTTRGSNFNGNIAHFLTTRNLGGGVAYVNTLCNKSYAHGVSMVYGTYNNAPAYSWTVEVVTHEIGHNLGSPHTHSCSWSTGPLDNCYTPEGTCATGPAPTNGGTIMSYCHLTSIGINFNNGFGFYPGNLIRDKVQNATCITGGTSSAAPTSLSTTNITQTSAALNWAATSGAVNYTVQYKLATASTWTSAGTTTSTTMNISALTAGNNYVWTVRSDCSAFATNASFSTTATTTCAVPASLTTTNITQTSATLNWAAAAGATNYTVQYKLATAATWTTSTATTAATMNISGLTAGNNYVWSVKSNCSAFSANASFTTTAATTCTVPTSLTTTNIAQTSATLNWAAAAGATNYTVQYKLATAATWTTTTATTSTSMNISGLTAATNYVWSVKSNCSAFSANASFTTTGSVGCTAPISLTTTNIAQTSATLNWGAVTGATGYTIQFKTAAATGWTSLNTTANSIVLNGLIAATAYNWLVKANCSPNSATVNFTTTITTTPPPAYTCTIATNLTETNITNNSAVLHWTGNVNAQSYTVQFREVGAATWTTYTVTTTSQSVRLRPHRSFEWTVNTKCNNGTTSGATAVRRFTAL
jgi:hypothetical protein